MGNCVLKQKLKSRTLDNTEPMLTKGIDTYCKVIDVYDGDTCTIAIPLNGVIVQEKLRLMGIDTPEIRTKNLEEKKAGKLAGEFLSSLILGKVLRVKLEPKREKFGRLLGTLFLESGNVCCFLDSENINQLMINKGYAVAYDGGTKLPFVSSPPLEESS